MSSGILTTALHTVWEYGRRELPYLAQALMELSLFVPFCLVFMPWARYWSVPQLFFLLLFLMLIPFNMMRLMVVLEVPLNQQRAILLGGLGVALIIMMRTLLYDPSSLLDFGWIGEFWVHLRSSGYPFWARDFSILGIVLYLWWRGIRLLDRSRDIDGVGLQFRLRALIFAPLVGYLASYRLEWSILPLIVLFCFSSLIIIILTRAEQIEHQASGFSFPITPRWLGVITLAGVSIVGIGTLIASSVTTESILGPPQTAVQFAAYTTFYTFINLVGPLFFVTFEWLSNILEIVLRPIAAMLANFQFEVAGPANQALPEAELNDAPDFLIDMTALILNITAGLILVLIIGLIVFGLIASVRAARKLQQRPEALSPPGEAERQEEELGWWERLRNVMPRFREWRAAASIRRIYRQMVLAGTAAGYPRQTAETPYEYLRRLHQAFPHNVTEVSVITDAYVRVHYGEVPETRAELNEIYTAWKSLEAHILELNS